MVDGRGYCTRCQSVRFISLLPFCRGANAHVTFVPAIMTRRKIPSRISMEKKWKRMNEEGGSIIRRTDRYNSKG